MFGSLKMILHVKENMTNSNCNTNAGKESPKQGFFVALIQELINKLVEHSTQQVIQKNTALNAWFHCLHNSFHRAQFPWWP